ncbi:S-methyl-5-thioribose-1-phosphate isomerase [Yersinia massiliensis]|uniref:S-methyl-5-thioribose-1-phosphate isomerase n=1 Tax=Yersinia massiliensis TaxID=419257 RepID=UPI0021BD10B5|nr:S-methyl-5-thioribose-1-phosphate isomerase [Yersinia massiliensis]
MQTFNRHDSQTSDLQIIDFQTTDLQTTSLRIVDGQLWILDQQALPQRQVWLLADTVALLIEHIQTLRVRGAPLIGLSASLLLALLAARGLSQAQLEQALIALRESRPTAVNLMNNLARMQQALLQADWVTAMAHEALRLVDEDRELCERIAQHGAALVKPGSNLLTHCNTGGLATAGIGTAIGVLLRAHQQGNVRQVWVDETRPLLQGGRLTAWELGELGIPYQLICDSMAASLMAQGQVDAVWVGADRIAANGDVANKIGTYSLAVLAHYHRIPFYVAAPHTTHDPACPNGAAIPIEQRAASEVMGVSGSFGHCQWAPQDAAVYNPAFDVTPAALISGWVLDSGVITPEQVAAGYFQPHP